MASKQNLPRLGENAWAKMPKVNGELFTLTYAAIVMQLIKDHEDIHVVNQHLEKMGHDIGCRIIDEFLSKSGVVGNCSSFRDTSEILCKTAFKMFLGMTCEVSSWNAEGTVFTFVLPSDNNPFIDFVELPPQYRELQYCGLLCGVICGALEMVQMKVECRFVRDVLKGEDVSEMRVELKGLMKNSVSDEYAEN